jgi:triacylglycerol lipase
VEILTMKRSVAVLTLACLTFLGAVPAHAADTYTKTKYPVVLVHGAFGFDAIGPVQYFYGIPDALRSGGATVYTPNVSQANNAEVRGEQLLRDLQQLKARYGHQKFNLVGHSQGGTTIRYVAAVAPQLVASVTTIGTPHQGSKVADAVQTVTSVTGTTGPVAALFKALANLTAFFSGSPGNPQDALESLKSLSTAGAQNFNRRFPQAAPSTACGQGRELVNGVRYYSLSGTSVLTNPLDISDPLLGANSVFFGLEANDGLVSRCSSRWGRVLRDDYGWNHGDQSNQVFGLRNVFSSDPPTVYRAQVNRLKGLGL